MKARIAQRVGFAAWGLLALLQVVWHAWLVLPQGASMGATLAIALLPLGLPLAYWRTPQRALLLAGMLGLFYFCHGVVVAWTMPHARALAWVEIALTVVLILSCARKPKRRQRAGAPPLPRGEGGA